MASTLPDPRRDPAFDRIVRWSFGAHAAIIVFVLVVPAEWLGLREPPRQYMTVNLGGGATGPDTTGTSSVSGRNVEVVTPPPPRPTPIKPTAPAVPPTPAATVSKPPPPKPEESRTAKPTAKPTPPATGRQISAGDSKVETGARTESQGLSSSAGGGLQADLDATFCCPEWAQAMKLVIEREWNSASRVRATTIVIFTVHRDGRVADVKVDRTSGDQMLDVEARRTMMTVKLPPLPAAYEFETLTVRLRFPYGGGW